MYVSQLFFELGIRLAKKFVRVLLWDVAKQPNELFGQPNAIIVYILQRSKRSRDQLSNLPEVKHWDQTFIASTKTN